MGRKYFKIILLLLLFIFCSSNSIADDALLIKKVEGYLNNFKTITVKFKQISLEDCKTKTGLLYISKPGKLRFEYLQPKKFSIILNKDTLMYHDYELEETSYVEESNYFFKLLSSKHIDLQKYIRKIILNKDIIKVFFTKKHAYFDNNIVIIFNINPLHLKELVFKTGEQKIYHLYFDHIVYNKNLDEKLFSVQNPKFYSAPY